MSDSSIYHFSAQVIGRSAGRSAVAASAYRSGSKMTDGRTGEIHDFSRKGGVFHSQVIAPAGAPAWMRDRSQLWNGVEAVEKRKDAQLAREFNAALPVGFTPQQQVELVREFVRENALRLGMVAQLDLHDLDSHNPHAHIMVTTRDIQGDGFGKKNRAWNSTEQLEEWRKGWADTVNRHLAKAGRKDRIDHRSLADQGITDREPTRHLGPHAAGFEKRTGQDSRRRQDMDAAMRERAQEAAQAKISQADLSGQIHAAEIQASELQRELATFVSPARASGDIARDLAQARADFRPAVDIVANQPAVKQARQRFEQAQKKREWADDQLVKARDHLSAVKQAARRHSAQVTDWKKKHPLLNWLHEHVHQSSTLRRMERQAEASKAALAPAQNAVGKASAIAKKVGKGYLVERDAFLDVQSTAVSRLSEQRRPTEAFIDRLANALAEARAREQQQAEQQRQAQQTEQRRQNLMGGTRLGDSSNTQSRPGGRPRPR